MEVLVTGATSRIGSHLIEALGQSCHITALGRRPLDYADHLDVTPVQLDITDTAGLTQVFKTTHYDAVVHLAAVAGRFCEDQPDQALAINTRATRNLGELVAEHEVERMINASTLAVYDPTVRGSKDLKPSSVYGLTKLEAERSLDELASQATKTSFVSQRIANVYGQGMDQSIITRLMTSEKISLRRQLYRDYIHVDDTVAGIVAGIYADSLPPRTHTVMDMGSGVLRSIEDVVAAIEEKGWKHNGEWSEEPTTPTYTLADPSLAEELLGFVPTKELVIPSSSDYQALAD